MNTIKTISKIKTASHYQARLVAPFAMLGIYTEEDWLTGIDYLPLDTPSLEPQNPLAREVCQQLNQYLINPNFKFDLSLHKIGRAHV